MVRLYYGGLTMAAVARKTTVTRRRRTHYSRAQVLLRNRFRLLWEQHVYWTRIVITGIAFDSPDLDASLTRLLRNVPDFATTLSRFYRPSEVETFSALFRDHLVIAAELVQAAKAGDNEAVEDLTRRWYANGDDIVQQMNRMNPFWRPSELKPMWDRHLDLTINEATQILTGMYTESVATFDEIEKEALMMADIFWKGIIRQFRI